MMGRPNLSDIIPKPKDGWRSAGSFGVEERQKLWPMAETLAMIDGNAFFTMGGEYQWEHVAQYLPQADALFQSNGGDNGWAGEAMLAKHPQAFCPTCWSPTQPETQEAGK